MKQYICLNHINCDWADEKPPRQFTLPNPDEPCPECGKFNTKVVKGKPPVGIKLKFALLGLAGLIIVWLVMKFLNPNPPTRGDSDNSKIKDSTITQIETGTNVGEKMDSSKQSGGGNTGEGSSKHNPPPVVPVKWTRVAGSEFCIPGTCFQAYSEIDNLGHTRERKIENCADCQMDEK